jgi:hypothetical protein
VKDPADIILNIELVTINTMGPKPKATTLPAKSRKKLKANLAPGAPITPITPASNVPIILGQEEGQEIQINEPLPPNPQPSPTDNEEIDDAKRV